MQRLFNYRIQIDIFFRAIAITLVLFDHMYSWRGRDDEYFLVGGSTVLMFLSGYNFSRFILSSQDPKTIVRSIGLFMWQIFWPTMALILILFAIKREFVWKEFLFISHWFTRDSFFPPFMPYWYVQVILQIFLGLMILFMVPGLRETIIRRPYVSPMIILLISVGFALICPRIWDTSGLYDWLPHLELWYFVLGWFVHASLERASLEKSRGGHGWIYRLMATAAILACTLTILWGAWNECIILSSCGLLMCWVSDVPVPKLLARPVLLCSQAVFTIYLLHAMTPSLSEKTLGKWFNIDEPLLDGALALTGCITFWVVCTAAQRAFRTLASRRKELPTTNNIQKKWLVPATGIEPVT